MSKYKAVIFDLDGTLLDTLDDLWDAVNHTMLLFGFPKRTRDEVRSFVGNGVDRLIELCVPDGRNNPRFTDAVAEYRRYYAEHSEIKTRLYSGTGELIDRLILNGCICVVVSNKMHEATVTLCRKYFPAVNNAYGERESDGIRRKPYPDMVIKAMNDIGVKPSECVYIGDSEVDIETARNSDIDCISVLWGFRDRELLESSGAACFAENTDELYRLIMR